MPSSTFRNRAAIYCRVSTLDQSNEIQLEELRHQARVHRWEIIEEYADQISGIKDGRPALERLMADAAAGRFDIVLCLKLDRFGRSLRGILNNVEKLTSLGVRF